MLASVETKENCKERTTNGVSKGLRPSVCGTGSDLVPSHGTYAASRLRNRRRPGTFRATPGARAGSQCRYPRFMREVSRCLAASI